MLSSGRAVFLLSMLTLFGSLPALAAHRHDVAKGNYGFDNDTFFGPSAVKVSDSNGALARITSFGKCASNASSLPCGWNGDPKNTPNSSPNFIYFYIVRVLRTTTGPLKLTIPGMFVDSNLGAEVDYGIVDDDRTSIAACSTPESDPNSLASCAAPYLDDTSSNVDGTQAVLVINSGLQADDTIELYIASFVPPACYAPLPLNSPPTPIDPSNCPANAQMAFALSGKDLTTSPPVEVVAPASPYPNCPAPQTPSPFCLEQQLNVSGADPNTPYDVSTLIPIQGSSLPISISATVTAGTPNFIINSTSKISWNGQMLMTKFSTLSNTPTVSATVSSSLFDGSGTAQVIVVTPGLAHPKSNPIAYTLLAQNPQITSFSPTAMAQGSGPFTLTVNGTGFVRNSTVQWNTSHNPNPDCSLADNRPTRFVSSTQVTATIPADDLRASTSIAPVIAVFAEPGNGSCNNGSSVLNEVAEGVAANTFTINSGSIPQLSALSIAFGNQTVDAQSSVIPITVTNNGNAVQSLTINSFSLAGANPGDFMFADSSTPCTAGKVLAATQSCNLALASSPIHAGLRTATLQISNNSKDPTLIVALTGTGVSPLPTLTSMSPTSILAGSAAFTLTLTGTNFTADSTVSFGGNPPASIMSQTATQLVVQVASASVATAGTLNVTVTNPAPGGGTSGILVFTVNSAMGVDFTMPASLSLSVTRGSHNAIAVSVGKVGNSTTSVTLKISGLPKNTSATLSPNPVKSGSSSTLTVTAKSTATKGTHTVTITGKNGSFTHSTPLTLTLK
jgi:hypothetical protein